MYFFQSILLVLMILITSFTCYQFLSKKKEVSISKKTIILTTLILMQALFLLFCANIIMLLFLDFPIFLGYLLRRRKEALLLSLVNIIYYSFFLSIPWYCYLIYFGYFFLSYLANSTKNTITLLICSKAFFTSIFCYLYVSQSVVAIFYLFFIFIVFFLFLEKNVSMIRNYEEENSDDTMLFQIAHEVKNPIAVCKGYLDMMDSSHLEKVQKYLPIVQSEMNRALTIMDDFLNLKRLTIQKDIMDFALLIEDVEATMQSILSHKKVELEVSKIEDELLLEGDYERLKQVLVNLIKNAYEANANQIKIEVTPKKEKIEVQVIDNGDGISEKDLKKIGKIFYTTKVKGTGIGVSMSKEIMKLNQGNIKYESTLKKGTKVTLTLPSKFLFSER